MTAQEPRNAVVIGGGPAGLMAAERLARAGCSVTLYERSPSVGRKLLLAGRGGLNLTHSEPIERFLTRYGRARANIAPLVEAFPPDALKAWCESLGVATFVGTSGRVFPESFKASPVLRAWLGRLTGLGVRIVTRRRWTGFHGERGLEVECPEGAVVVEPDAVVLALGGASWPRLGADGSWVGPFEQAGVAVSPLEPANCGFTVTWSQAFADRFAGRPLKRAALSFAGETVRGEAIVTADGIEGGMVYALSGPMRDAIAQDGAATAEIDLRPDHSIEALASKLARPRGKRSLSTHLAKAAGLDPVATGLLREAGAVPEDPEALARRIKALPIRLRSAKPLARAISTAGGVRFDGLDETLMIRARPGVFVAGEMLDWEARTGGYLLQACFATGTAAGEAAARWAHR